MTKISGTGLLGLWVLVLLLKEKVVISEFSAAISYTFKNKLDMAVRLRTYTALAEDEFSF